MNQRISQSRTGLNLDAWQKETALNTHKINKPGYQ